MEAEEKKPVPPYVAFRTLGNFLDRFKQGLPGRIDRGLMSSMSGAAQSQVTTALRYLGLISEHGLPTSLMRRYVTGNDDERSSALREMLQSAYKFLFADDFDISTATASQLREAFEKHTTASGETLNRCITFFKDAAESAGVKVSPFILQKRARLSAGKRKPQGTRRTSKAVEPSVAEPTSWGSEPMSPSAIPAAQASLLLLGLFQRLPKPGSTWSREEREKWTETLNNVLLLEYPEKG